MSSSKATAPSGEAQNAASTEDGHEMNEIAPATRPPLPIENDIMQLSRLGELEGVRKLIEGGKFAATYTDEDGITALHVGASGI